MTMIDLIPISGAGELGDDLKEIYISSFPSDERRDWCQMERLICQPNFSLHKILNKNELIGFISLWNLPGFVFIEHFAIVETQRGKGFGTQVFKLIFKEQFPRVVLEVEEPTTQQAQSRISFYSRQGFAINNGTYYQPPYSPDKNKVKLLLMSYPDKLTPATFEETKKLIHKNVYQFNDSKEVN